MMAAWTFLHHAPEKIAESTFLEGGTQMSTKATDPSRSLFNPGTEQTEAMVNMQKELLAAYEQASRAWLARMKAEVDLWSQLASKLSATRSAPEVMQAYQECVAQRMQMAAEDGRRLTDDCQKVMSKIGSSFSNGWPSGSS
jgi:hypothetical protein